MCGPQTEDTSIPSVTEALIPRTGTGLYPSTSRCKEQLLGVLSYPGTIGPGAETFNVQGYSRLQALSCRKPLRLQSTAETGAAALLANLQLKVFRVPGNI